MEIKELKKKTVAELHKILANSREKMRELRFKDANKQLKNVREIRTIRQVIARTMMLLNAKNKTASVSDTVVNKEVDAEKKLEENKKK